MIAGASSIGTCGTPENVDGLESPGVSNVATTHAYANMPVSKPTLTEFEATYT